MSVPYYWKRGLLAGVSIGIVLSFLIGRLDRRSQQMTSNIPVEPEQVYATPRPRTDFGMFVGVVVFALFCVVPGPFRSPGEGQEPAPTDQK